MLFDFLGLTSSCGTGEMEARIQRRTLSPVATSVLLAIGFSHAVAGCLQLIFEGLIAERPEKDKRGILGIGMLNHNAGAHYAALLVDRFDL